MDEAHWLTLLLAAIFVGLLTCFSLAARPETRAYRAARRAFWALALAQTGAALGGPGLNGVSLGAALMLGAPGYAAVWALTLL